MGTMAESNIDVYIKLFQIFIMVLILSILIYRRKKDNIKALNWFIWVFIFAVIHGIAELVIYHIKINILSLSNPSHFRFNEYHSIPYSISILILYMLGESIISLKPNHIRFSIAVALWTSFISLLFYETFNNYDLVYNFPATDNISNTIFDFFQIYVMGFLSYVFFLSRRESNNPKHKRATFWMFFASLTYSLSILYELGEDLLNFPNIYGAITLGLSFIVLAYIFVRYPYYTFSVPTHVYRLIITSNKHQSMIYSAELIHPKKSSSSSELLASAISAISSFMVNTTGSNESLHFADLGDRSILIVRGKLVSGIILTENSTFILRSALKQLVIEFENKYDEELISFNADISQFENETKHIIAQCFPFIESEETIKLKIERKN